MGVGMGGAHKGEMRLARVGDVIGVLPQAFEQLNVFDARHGLATAIFVS